MTIATAADIPQTDPRAGYLEHRDEIDAAVKRVLESGWYILGEEVRSFEREFAKYIGVAHAIGVGSGTDALELALSASGVGKGDVVFTVSHTAVATVAAIESAGATAVFVDIDPVTFTMDPARLEEAITKASRGKSKAIVPVHLYGHPCDLEAITEIAKRHNLDVIEDCAQSHGAAIGGRTTGSIGKAAAFSFYPTKNLGAFGDGGMIVTDDAELAQKVRLLQQYGWKERYISEIAGRNSRLDELHAGMLRVKLRYLEEDNARRRAIASSYDSLLASGSVTLPTVASGTTHAYHQYVIRHERRDALRAHLREQGVGSLIHYPVPVHLQPAYASRVPSSASLPETERAAREILSIPMFPQLTDDQVQRVADVIREFDGEGPQ